MVGEKIQHYAILKELGRGGMGTVYEAEDSRLGRRVAIKVLPAQAVRDRMQVERFKREARAASALNHPNIVTIHDIIESDDLQCIVMERIEGRTLREWMHDKPSPDDAIAVTAQIARAVAAAHGAGVVHRDIKPDNIMIRADGIVKMLDFGLAKLVDQSRLTRDGALVGTVAYMSPEQTRGDEVDERTDVWSLGVVLYEILAGKQPFAADYDQAVLYNILNSQARPVTDNNPEISAPLASLVMDMLEKDPARRPAAREVALALSGEVTAKARGEVDAAVRTWEPTEGRRPVAVLPFKLLSGESDCEFLSLALAEAVSHGLSSNPQLVVRPTSAVVKYAQRDVNPMAVARDLGVSVVVEGSIQKLGSQVRVQVQAWDATRGSTLLSVKLDGQFDDLFGLQDRLADKLGEGMGLAPGETATERPTQNAQAYELFLRATERVLRYDKPGFARGIEMLRSAVALDPQFANAWSRLAVALVNMEAFIDPDVKWFNEAETAIERALALDAGNPEAWTARGRLLWTPHHDFQHAQALRDLGKACCHPSGPADAPLWRGTVLSHIGLHEEGIASAREAHASQPDDLLSLLVIGETLSWNGEYDGGLEYLQEVVARDPAFPFGHLFLPTPLIYLDRLEEAESAIATGRKIVGDDSMILASEALLWAKRGEVKRSKDILRVAMETVRSVSHAHHAYHHAATAWATIGDAAQAVAMLEKAAKAGMPNYPVFMNDIHFRALHGLPEFDKLISNLKTGWEAFRSEFGARAAGASGVGDGR